LRKDLAQGAHLALNRRTLIGTAALTLCGATATVRGQVPRPRRIGFLANGTPEAAKPQREAFLQALRELGWIEGSNAVVEYRWAQSDPDRLPGLVAELLQANVEVIVLSGSTAIRAAQKATRTVPIVFVVLADPVTSGFVKSLARPGGNMTGVASQYEELITKQLQLLKEALPRLSRVALLYYTDISSAIVGAAEVAAHSLGLTTRVYGVSGVADFQKVFEGASKERVGAIQVLPSPWFNGQRALLIDLAAKHRLPAFYEFSNYVTDGGLMSYGPSISDMHGRAATYVDRILKGAKTAELPIERPTRFELVINLRTADALGLTIPRSILQRADRVVE